LDPCSNPQSQVGAVVEWSLELGFDGLALDWTRDGLTYCNPPFGRALKRWSKKIIHEADCSSEIVSLTPSRTGSAWCQAMLRQSDAHLFWAGRITFVGAAHPAPFDCVVCYFGARPHRFRRAFDGRGLLEVHPRRRRRGAWFYELRLETSTGRRWQRSEPLTYAQARDAAEGWRARGFATRLIEAA
jgi:site-specific DNA-methyltransferase (adenine-specific)